MKQQIRNSTTNSGRLLIVGATALLACISCKKGFLNEKPNQSIVLLNSIKNLQGILDNDGIFNDQHPSLGEQGSDDYYVKSEDYNAFSKEQSRNVYRWAPGYPFFDDPSVIDWDNSYKAVFYANTALDEIEKVDREVDYVAWDNLKGSALFYRAYTFYNLAQVFCKPYFSTTAHADMGIVLRLIPDINQPSERASVLDTYSQILNDLLESKDLLPVTPQFRTRPSKPAVYGMLARVYLSMREYDKAYLYADSCLQLFNGLLDYKSLNSSLPFPITPYPNNPETIFHVYMNPALVPNIGNATGRVDTVLYSLYQANDLRKNIFFREADNKLQFKGSYTGSVNTFFSGLSTNEILLIRAECLARKGHTSGAQADLAMLLEKRYSPPFPVLNFSTPEEALQKILLERRKELCFRGLRWSDLRRLNQEQPFQKTLFRIINGQTYQLRPNDERYVYPIPDNEIVFSGIPQNPR